MAVNRFRAATIALLIASAFLLPRQPASASVLFENSYVSFRLPDGWTCRRDGTEFVCGPPLPPRSRTNVIFILTAKLIGPSDTLAAYRAHLDRLAGRPGITSVVPAALRTVRSGASSAVWVDATLDHPEIRGYRTRYLATTKSPVAILVTFSARIRDYLGYQGVAFQAVQSLQAKTYQPRR